MSFLQASSTPKPLSTIPSSSTARDSHTFQNNDVKIADAIENVFEILQPIINLIKAKIHIPLTLLTYESIKKIHNDPSSVKLCKGLVLDDPKHSVLDTSGFPPESSMLSADFNEAYDNFIALMELKATLEIISPFMEHRQFCLK
ncbi:hypothetical protein BDR05DRAFT_996259 [Suillus weaverae]|nr:hypothetical protein BDR05DRAFT_996259 [Suillus weaverae]